VVVFTGGKKHTHIPPANVLSPEDVVLLEFSNGITPPFQGFGINRSMNEGLRPSLTDFAPSGLAA
jgi:hypothetical protein